MYASDKKFVFWEPFRLIIAMRWVCSLQKMALPQKGSLLMTKKVTKMTHYSTKLHKQFVSRDQRNRDEALCSHYRAIGIQAVAAAKCVRSKNSRANGTVTYSSSLKQS
ncbi:MAG: hypothetical protein ACR2O0_15105 [Rhizobiaceae bacterium]